MKLFLTIILTLAAALPLAADNNTDPVLVSMRVELKRDFAKLENAEQVPLYYLNYEITDRNNVSFTAVEGGMENDAASHNRYLDVDARAGDRRLDNTHEFKGTNAWMGDNQRKISVSIEDDEDSLRASLWKWTDTAYKNAQERYKRVKINKAVTAEEEDKSDDFSKDGNPQKFYEKVELPPFDRDQWREKVKAYSAKFMDQPFIYNSRAGFSATAENRYMVSSEGTDIRTGNVYLTLNYYLATRTTDGMDLYRTRSYHGEKIEDMPPDSTVYNDISQSIAELKALKDAPLVDPYHGPVILKNRAAAVYFHEIFGHRVEGHRQKSESEGQTFTKKLNEKIVSDFLTIYDDPTLERFNGTFLRGYYKFDDQGEKAQKASIVENGILRGFLMSRSPIKGFPDSNGHGRREPGFPVVSRMGNTIVKADKQVPYDELRKMLIEECKKQGKPFGLVFEDISGGFTHTGRGGVQAFKVQPLLVYRVYVDGRPDEVVRGVDIVGTPLAAFSKIMAAANDDDIFNGTCGAESGWVPVSGVAPSLLLSEMEVEKVGKSQNKPPVLDPPFSDK